MNGRGQAIAKKMNPAYNKHGRASINNEAMGFGWVWAISITLIHFYYKCYAIYNLLTIPITNVSEGS